MSTGRPVQALRSRYQKITHISIRIHLQSLDPVMGVVQNMVTFTAGTQAAETSPFFFIAGKRMTS
jgi:hypothetical protein